MKNKKYLLGLLSAFAILLLGNCQENNKTKSQQEEYQTLKTNPVVDPPSNIISLEQADAIYTNYGTHRVAVIENYETKERAPEEKFQASRFVDFDYQMIKDYIAFVDQEAAKAGVKKVSKLRMYFANYPNEKKFPDGKEVVHQRQNSIFLLPTMPINGGDFGFYIGDDGEAKLITDWQSERQDGIGYLSNKTEKNHASLVPTFYTGSSLSGGQSLTLNYGNAGPPPRTDF